jgi:hypothetical protein
MKKTVLLIISLMIFITCEDKEKDVSPFVGTWTVTFIGEYENTDCTGEIDSSGWDLKQALGFEKSLTFNKDGSYEMSMTEFGSPSTETGTWEEKADGSLCLGIDNCMMFSMAAFGHSFTITDEVDAFCRDSNTFEETDHADSTSCQEAGNNWYEASCSITVYTKQ